MDWSPAGGGCGPPPSMRGRLSSAAGGGGGETSDDNLTGPLLRPKFGEMKQQQKLDRPQWKNHQTRARFFGDHRPNEIWFRPRAEPKLCLGHAVLTLVTLACFCLRVSLSEGGLSSSSSDGLSLVNKDERPTIQSVNLKTEIGASLNSLPTTTPIDRKPYGNETAGSPAKHSKAVISTQGIVPYRPAYLQQSMAASVLDTEIVAPTSSDRDAGEVLETAASKKKKKMMKKQKKMEKKHKEWKKGKKHKKKKYESKKKKGGMEKKKKGKLLKIQQVRLEILLVLR